MFMNRYALILCCGTCLSGCASYSPDQVAKPTDITIQQALTDVIDGIADARDRADKRKILLGVAVCSVVTNFNVTAQATKGGKLVLDGTIKAPAPVNAGLGFTAEQNTNSVGSRGNTVAIVLTSEACLPAGVAGTAMAQGIYGGKPAGEPAASSAPRAPAPAAPAGPSKTVVSYPQPGLHDIFRSNGAVILTQ
jgi:hypothetical protein